MEYEEIGFSIFTSLSTAPRRGTAGNKAPLLLLRICHRWRHIALETPRLFTKLVIPNTRRGDPLSLVSLYLNHSGALPFEFHIRFTKTDPGVVRVPGGHRRLFEQLHNNFERIKVLRLHNLPSLKYLAVLFPFFSESRLPTLVDLEISAIQHDLLGGIVAPKLERICFHSNGYQWQDIIRAYEPKNLKTLLDYGRESYDGEDMLRLFKEHPHLKECKLVYEEKPDSFPFTPQPSQLLSLTFLGIRFNRESEHFFELVKHLHTPNLETLEFLYEGNNVPTRGCIAEALTAWARACKPPLKKIALQFVMMAIGEYDELWISLPGLENITIYFGRLHSRNIDFLNRDLNPKILPQLKQLVLLSCYVDMPSMVEMLRSRCAVPKLEHTVSGSSMARMTYIEMSKIVVPDPNVLLAVQEEFPQLEIKIW